MFPDLFSVGPITFHTYGFFVTVGFAAGLLLTLKIGRSLGIDGRLIVEMAVYMIPAAIAGSRALYVMMNFGDFGDNLSDILKIWQGRSGFSGGDHRRYVDDSLVCENPWAFLLGDGRSMGTRRSIGTGCWVDRMSDGRLRFR